MSSARGYTQTHRAAATERTRTAILDAAEAEFLAGRFEEVTLEGIAAAAGTTKMTVLRHFGSKSGLVAAGAERAQSRVREQRWQAPPNDVEAAIENLLEHYEEAGTLALQLGAMGESIDELKPVLQDAKQLHYDWVEHAFGEALGNDPNKRAALIAICDVHSWNLLARDLKLSRDQVKETLILMVKGVLE